MAAPGNADSLLSLDANGGIAYNRHVDAFAPDDLTNQRARTLDATVTVPAKATRRLKCSGTLAGSTDTVDGATCEVACGGTYVRAFSVLTVNCTSGYKYQCVDNSEERTLRVELLHYENVSDKNGCTDRYLLYSAAGEAPVKPGMLEQNYKCAFQSHCRRCKACAPMV